MMSDRQVARVVQVSMARAAQETSAFMGCTINEEVSPGRWEVTLDGGQVVVLSVTKPCQQPLKGAKWDVSRRENNILALDGPSGFG